MLSPNGALSARKFGAENGILPILPVMKEAHITFNRFGKKYRLNPVQIQIKVDQACLFVRVMFYSSFIRESSVHTKFLAGVDKINTGK